jgi:hypothetical protein
MESEMSERKVVALFWLGLSQLWFMVASMSDSAIHALAMGSLSFAVGIAFALTKGE